MAIPKYIFQTFKTKKLPLITRYHIWRIKKLNPDYIYYLYDDEDIVQFLKEAFPIRYLNACNRLTIGAAKADFFRYAIIYKKGGVYLDIDSGISKPLHELIQANDTVILRRERHPQFFVQWAIISEKGHPFLKKTLELIVDNIENHRFPNDVHQTTGPTAYTKAINECINEEPDVSSYRVFNGIEFRGFLKFKYKFGNFFYTEINLNTGKRNNLQLIL